MLEAEWDFYEKNRDLIQGNPKYIQKPQGYNTV